MREITDIERNKVLLLALSAELFVFTIIAVALFAPIRNIQWYPAWVFLLLTFSFTTALCIYLYHHNPKQLRDRIVVFTANQFAWDKVFLTGFYLLSLAWFVFMPLDVRHHWGRPLRPDWLSPFLVQAVGVVLLLCAFTIIFVVIRENPYASPVVQVVPRHFVIMTGPYTIIRHPLYLGAIIFYIGTPFILLSGWGFAFCWLFPATLCARIIYEEESLTDFLPGYKEYMTRVKYRLIPFIW